MGFLILSVRKKDSQIWKNGVPFAFNTDRIVNIKAAKLPDDSDASILYYNETLQRPSEYIVPDSLATLISLLNSVGGTSGGGGGGGGGGTGVPPTVTFDPTTGVLTINGTTINITPLEKQQLSFQTSTNVLNITNGQGSILSSVDLSSLVSGGAPTGEVNSAANLGSGIGTYESKTGATLNFRGIKAGANIAVTLVGNDIEIAAATPPNITGQNVGTGTGLVFKDKVSDTMNFKTIRAGAGITLTNGANDITIAAAAASMQNIGGQTQVYVVGSGAPFDLRTFYSSNGSVVFTQETDKIDVKTAVTNFRRNLIIATANNQVSFSITHAPINPLQLEMNINGQMASQDMFSVSGTNVTFIPTNAGYQIDTGDKVEFTYFSTT